MTLVVHACGAYPSYSRDDCAWRNGDYGVNRFVKALKGKQFSGYADLFGTDQRFRRITHEQPAGALDHFALWSAQQVHSLQLMPAVLVPVPSSECTVFGQNTAPRRMANALAAQLGGGWQVENWLRFGQVLQKSSEGGTRSRSIIQAALIPSASVAPVRVVLLDDVKTTGAHLRACANVLRAAGATVETALVAATTVWDQVAEPWHMEPEELEQQIDLSAILQTLKS